MAKLNETSKGILGKASEKIGSYKEAPGGGTPLGKGEKAPSKEWVDSHRQMQPRDEDGQFTYNSVNGKGLKYGPSRGTTVPPFLKGIKLTFCEPGTKLKIEGEDGIQVRIMTIDMTVAEIVNACKEYIESEEGFAGMGKGSSIVKKGRKSEEEKKAESGQIGKVDPKTLSEGTQKKMEESASEYAKSNSANPVDPTVNGYKVLTDILGSDGETTKVTPARYWERTKGETKSDELDDKYTPLDSDSSTKSTGSDDVASRTTSPLDKGYEGISDTDEIADGEKSSEDKLLGSMGLSPEDVKKEEPKPAEDVKFDAEEVRKDPKAFYNKYKDIIKGMVNDFNSRYPDKKIDARNILQIIKDGKLKDLATWKKKFSK